MEKIIEIYEYENIINGLSGKRIIHGDSYLIVPTLTRKEIKDFIKSSIDFYGSIDKTASEIENLFKKYGNIDKILSKIQYFNGYNVSLMLSEDYDSFVFEKYREINPDIPDATQKGVFEVFLDVKYYSPLEYEVDILEYLSFGEWKNLLMNKTSE